MQQKSVQSIAVCLLSLAFSLSFACLPCPVFTQPLYTGYVHENATTGTSVLTVTAYNTYGDIIEYDTIDTNLPFHIETTTGIIRLTTSPLDYSAQNQYEVIIKATVSGYGYTKSVVATIYVLNSPDPPVICQTFNTLIFVYENTLVPYNSTEWINCTRSSDVPFFYQTEPSSPISIDTYGFIIIHEILDYENISSYDIAVTFTDIDFNQIIGDLIYVTLRVLPLNEYAPIFLNNNYTFTIPESTGVGNNIGHVSAIDFDKGPDGQFVFNIQTTSNYTMITENGELYTIDSLDYEQLHSFELTVTVSDTPWNITTSLTSTAIIYIKITNENDNPPNCPTVSSFEIPINTMISSISIAALSCTDPDNDYLIYLIEDSKDERVILKTNSEQNTTTLILNATITNEYSIWTLLSASDGYHVINFYVFVHFISLDLSPVFTSSIYTCTIYETTPIGDVVCMVHANGSDHIHYSLISNDYNNFVILSSTGELVLLQSLDYESINNYSITVRCENFLNPMLADTAVINILVRDSNDNKPTIQEYIFSNVTENAAYGTTVTNIQCNDNDTNIATSIIITEVSQSFQNGSLLRGVESYPFDLNQLTGDITVNGDIDYEVTNSFIIKLQCSDNDIPNLTSTSTVSVNVIEVNEFPPVFMKPSPSDHLVLTLYSNVTVGTLLYHFEVNDKDEGSAGKIKYSLLQDSSELEHIHFLSIDNSGNLYTTMPVPCQYGLILEYYLNATDSDPMNPLTTTTSFTIFINECHTLIASLIMYSVSVPENIETDTEIIQVQCYSLTTQNVSISYNLTDHKLFHINSKTGVVSVVSPLDYETKTSHDLSVHCYYDYNPLQYLLMSVYVTVQSINDNVPKFKDTHNKITVSEDTVPGTVLITLEAQDLDSGRDGELIYSLKSSQNSFGINPSTGDVYLSSYLDRENINNYTLLVTVNDNPLDSSSINIATSTLNIQVSDVNDNRPKCLRELYKISLSPYLEIVGRSIMKLDCSDPDNEENGTLSFLLLTEQTMFSINSSNGDIILKEPITSNVSPFHTIAVMVQDNGKTTRLNTTVYIGIEINMTGESVGGEVTKNEIQTESQQNIVTLTVTGMEQDFLWNNDIKELIKTTIADSTTTYCILYPSNCSLLSLCTAKLSSECTNYIKFKSSDVSMIYQTAKSNLTVLQISLYIKLPHDAVKSPFRQTNYVIPQTALNAIVQNKKDVISALVSDTVGNITILYGLIWKELAISLLVIFIIVFGVIITAVTVTYVHKRYKMKSKTSPSVQPIQCDQTKVIFLTPQSAKSSSDGCSLMNVSEDISGTNSECSYGANNQALLLNSIRTMNKKEINYEDFWQHPFAIESHL